MEAKHPATACPEDASPLWDALFKRIPLLYTILAAMVVILHADNRFMYQALGDSMGKSVSFWIQKLISGNLCEMAVPIFLLLSGFLFYRDLSWGNMGSKLLRRARSLLVPYLAWNGLYTAVILGGGAIPALSGFFATQPGAVGLAEVLKGIFLHAYNPAAWFLWELILLSLLCPAIFPFMNRLGTGAALTAAFFILALEGAHTEYFVLEGAFYYLLGAFVGRHYPKVLLAPGRSGALVGGLVFLGLSQWLFFYNNGAQWDTGGTFFLYRVCIALGGLGLLLLLPPREARPWMRASFFVYLAHGLMLSALRALLAGALPMTGWASLWVYAITAAVTLPAAIGLAMALRRICPPLMRVLGGGRG